MASGNGSLPSSPDPAVMEAIEKGHAVVFMDVALGGSAEDGSDGKLLGRIKLELFIKDCPKTW